MKKYLSLFFCLGFFSEVFCLGRVTLWHTFDVEHSQLIKRITKDFNLKHPKTPIVVEDIFDMNGSLIKGSYQKRLPEIALAAGDLVALYKVASFSQIPTKLYRPSPFKSLNQLVQIDGKSFGVPALGGNFLLLFYNKALVKQPISTWDQLSLKKLSNNKNNSIAWSYLDPFYFMPFLSHFGAKFVDKGVPLFTDSKFIQSLVFYKNLSIKNKIPINCEYKCSVDGFLNGSFAYTLNGDWFLKKARHRLGANLGVAAIPGFKGRAFFPSVALGFSLFFPNNSLNGPHAKILHKFITYFQSLEVQKMWILEHRIPIHPEAIKLMKQDSLNAEILSILEDSISLNDPTSTIYLWSLLRKAMTLILKNNEPTSLVLPRINQLAVELLKEKNN